MSLVRSTFSAGSELPQTKRQLAPKYVPNELVGAFNAITSCVRLPNIRVRPSLQNAVTYALTWSVANVSCSGLFVFLVWFSLWSSNYVTDASGGTACVRSAGAYQIYYHHRYDTISPHKLGATARAQAKRCDEDILCCVVCSEFKWYMPSQRRHCRHWSAQDDSKQTLTSKPD